MSPADPYRKSSAGSWNASKWPKDRSISAVMGGEL